MRAKRAVIAPQRKRRIARFAQVLRRQKKAPQDDKRIYTFQEGLK